MPDLGHDPGAMRGRPTRERGASGGAFPQMPAMQGSTGPGDGLSLRAILARTEILAEAWDPDRPIEDGWTPEDDHRYRTLYERKDRFLGVLPYDEARIAYRIGRLAARSPALRDKTFEAAEARLAQGWDDVRWGSARPYVQLGFERCRFDDRLERSRRAVERLERSWSADREPRP